MIYKQGDERRRECLRCKHRWTTVEQPKVKVEMMQSAVKKAREIGELLAEERP